VISGIDGGDFKRGCNFFLIPQLKMSAVLEKTHDNDLTKSKSGISGSRKRGSLVPTIDESNEKDLLPPVGRQYKKTKITISDETTISVDSGKTGDLKNRYEAEDDFPLTSFLQTNEERKSPPDRFPLLFSC